ncbi:MAG: (Fe-S)-binding protein [Acidimicrobiia bacterium]
MVTAPWITEFRPTAAELSSCVQCGLCLPHCPTFRLTGLEIASPRGRLAAMNAVADRVVELDATFEDAMTFCLNCRACESVCPSMVPFGRAMEGARAEITAQRPTFSRRFRHFVLGRIVPNRLIVRLATLSIRALQRLRLTSLLPSTLGRSLGGLRPLHQGLRTSYSTPQGTGSLGTVGILAGCVMDPWFSRVNQAAVELLSRAGYKVVVPSIQTCCGALAAHDGAMASARRLAATNIEAFAGLDVVVATAAGCSAHLKDYGHAHPAGGDLAGRSRDITEVVAELIDRGLLPTMPNDRGNVAVQDPCHLRHAQRVTAAPRRILSAAGYRPLEIDPDGLCCGAAGIYSLLRPEASAELGIRKAIQVRGSGSTLVASANPGCEIQLRIHLDSNYRIAHPVELYWEALTEPRQG